MHNVLPYLSFLGFGNAVADAYPSFFIYQYIYFAEDRVLLQAKQREIKFSTTSLI